MMRKNVKHPVQPLLTDPRGILRFKSNAIVVKMLDVCTKHGYDLNRIAREEFANEDRAQLAQLIGYSLSGFGDLSYVSDELYDIASNQLK